MLPRVQIGVQRRLLKALNKMLASVLTMEYWGYCVVVELWRILDVEKGDATSNLAGGLLAPPCFSSLTESGSLDISKQSHGNFGCKESASGVSCMAIRLRKLLSPSICWTVRPWFPDSHQTFLNRCGHSAQPDASQVGGTMTRDVYALALLD